MNSTDIVPGSLSAISRQNGQSIAESFMSADVVIIVDVSGSMTATDSLAGRSRYETAIQELAGLQAKLPGKLAVIAFSGSVEFIPGGVPPLLSGGTDLAAALRFVKVADDLVRFVVISDGEPDDPEKCLALAGQFKSKIDTIFVGPENDPRGGRDFLARLAAASGGKTTTADRATELASKVETLLLTA